jgi:AcrR family transcriptional regulator
MSTDGPATARRKRANGEQSRRRILAAAAEVASERGYEGTSIALVSAKCGLPASSIYWHFKDKDDLIAAVIESSFAGWLAAIELPGDQNAEPLQRGLTLAAQVAKALLDTPDFLRLGLMLSLERRPEEPRARTMFLQVRAVAVEQVATVFRELAPSLEESEIRLLTTYAMAGADGLFVAHQIGGPDAVDLPGLFALHAHAVHDAMTRLVAERARR